MHAEGPEVDGLVGGKKTTRASSCTMGMLATQGGGEEEGGHRSIGGTQAARQPRTPPAVPSEAPLIACREWSTKNTCRMS